MRIAGKMSKNASATLFFALLWLAFGSAFARLNELDSCELSVTEAGLQLVLTAEAPLTFSTYWLRDPLRLMFEFPATQTDKGFVVPRLGPNALLKHLKIEKGSENGGITRLVLEPFEILDFQTKPDGARLTILLRPLRLNAAPSNALPQVADTTEISDRQKAEAAAAAARLAEEKRQAEETAKLRAEEERRLALEAETRRLALEKRQAEEAAAARLALEKRQAEEAAKLRAEEERRLALEAETKRLALEKRRAEEAAAARLALEKRQAEEAAKLRAEEERRLALEAETRRLALEKRKSEEAAATARLAEERRQAEEAAKVLAEAAKRKAEASHLAALPVRRLGEAATFLRLGFQAQGSAAVVWFDLSAPTQLDYEWKDKETLLVRLGFVRVQNRVNLYPLNTEAFGSAVRYVRPDYDPKAHIVTLAIGVLPNTPFRMEMEKRRVELLFGEAKPVLPLPPTVKLKNPENEE